MILREGRSGALNYSAKEPNNWVEQEAGDCEFEDVRLGRRLVSLLGQIGGSVEKAFLLPARIGRMPRRPIAFSPTSALVKRIFSRAFSGDT